MNKKLLLIIGLLTTIIDGYCQTIPSFTYNTAAEQKLIEAITSRYTKDVATVHGSNKKYIADIYKERYNLIKDRVREKEVLTDVKAQEYLSALSEEIFKHNASLQKNDFRILFSRTYLPNATSMGEGTIFFNIGLFHRLQNESQAAFILCHEIAHYILDHSNKNIEQYVNTVYSDEFQKQLKDIGKSEFNRNAKLEGLSTNLLFKSRRHSRYLEESADSMALELMKNTRYDTREALSVLSLLDSADKDKYGAGLELSKVFNFPAFPFKRGWLQSDDLIFAISKEEKIKTKKEEDSLKTHPDCSARIERLLPKVNQYQKQKGQNFIISEKTFTDLKTAFDYEMIDYCYQSNKISKSLFLALEMLSAYPNDSYLQAMVGKCLNKIYHSQKKHELNKIVDLPNPAHEPAYNNLVQMIQNLRLSEIAAISYFFLQQYEQQSSANEEFVAALIESKSIFGKNEEMQKWILYYNQKFSNRKYSF